MSHIYTAVCTLGKVRIEWAFNFATADKAAMRDNWAGIVKGLSTVDARNTAVQAARTSGADYLLFWDDDLAPQRQDAVPVLVSAADQLNLDVIGGVYPMRRHLAEPCVCQFPNGGTFWGWRDGKIHEVFMVGTAFMLIRADVFDRIEAEEYVAPTGETLRRYFDHPGEVTDDFFFANLCAKAGVKQHVHGDVICDQIDLDGRVYKIEPQVELAAT